MADPLHNNTPATGRAAAFAVRLLAALALLAVLSQITACGGGGDAGDEPDVPTPAVDCKAHPELCK